MFCMMYIAVEKIYIKIPNCKSITTVQPCRLCHTDFPSTSNGRRLIYLFQASKHTVSVKDISQITPNAN